jgi:hypothetical protein
MILPACGNCSVCQNVGKLSTFNVTYSQKPELHISLIEVINVTIYEDSEISTF